MLAKNRLLILVALFMTCVSHASEEGKPLWEYGLGIGYARYAQYPSSDQYSELTVPFPTFQYRGEFLRADDRDGGRAYLLKNDHWSLELSGGGRLPLDSSKNQAREGMEDLPFVLEGGPQLVYSENRDWEFKLALFPALAIDGSYIRQNGLIFNAKAQYRWEEEWTGPFSSPLLLNGTLSFKASAASKEYNATYFEVSPNYVTATRPEYEAAAGFLEGQISYFQRISAGRLTVYLAASYSDFSSSVNRQSFLHRSDSNIEYALGLTYVLGESKELSVPPEETEGMINKAIQHRKDRLIRFE